jgi:hypothetical protein
MREINKDLKNHFKQLEEKVALFLKENGSFDLIGGDDSESNKEN